MMSVSRKTFGRIQAETRAIVEDALVMVKTLRIEGGHFDMSPRGRGRRDAKPDRKMLNSNTFDYKTVSIIDLIVDSGIAPTT